MVEEEQSEVVQILRSAFLKLGDHFGIQYHESNLWATQNGIPRAWERIELQSIKIDVAFSPPREKPRRQVMLDNYALLRIAPPEGLFIEQSLLDNVNQSFIELGVSSDGDLEDFELLPAFHQQFWISSEKMLVASLAMYCISNAIFRVEKDLIISGPDSPFMEALRKKSHPVFPNLVEKLLENPEGRSFRDD